MSMLNYIKLIAVICVYLVISSCSSWKEARNERIENQRLIEEWDEYYQWVWDNYPDEYYYILDSISRNDSI
jgi:hypothetical protein